MTILTDYTSFSGRNWETAAFHNYLAHRGFNAPHTGQPYSEAFLMGVSGGAVIGYFSFVYEGVDPLCRILTRNTFNPLETMQSRLGIVQDNVRTASAEKAEANLRDTLASGVPAIVWADLYSLPYNGHGMYPEIWMVVPILVYGIEDGQALIADRAAVPLTAPLEDLAAARGRIKKEKNHLQTISPPNEDKLLAAAQAGIWDCIKLYTEDPPRGSKNNFGLQAFKFWAENLTKPKARLSWAKIYPPGREMYAGLWGAYHSIHLFDGFRQAERPLYADFLEECSVLLENQGLREAAGLFRESGKAWDALGLAILPNEVPVFKEARELMERRENVFVEQGNAALDEILSIEDRLTEIKDQMESDFPLTEAEVVEMRERIAAQVLAVHDAEKAAVDALIAAMA